MFLRRALVTAVATAGLVLIGNPATAFATDGDELPALVVPADETTTTTTTSSTTTSSSSETITQTSTTKPGDLDCDNFATQAEAQAVLDRDRTDPNNLDRDKDGYACESKFGAPQVKAKPSGGVDTGGGDYRDGPGGLVALTGLVVLGTGALGALLLRRRVHR